MDQLSFTVLLQGDLVSTQISSAPPVVTRVHTCQVDRIGTLRVQPLAAVRAVSGRKLCGVVAKGGKHGHRGWYDLAHQSEGKIVGARGVSGACSLVPSWAFTGHDDLDGVGQHTDNGQAAVLGLLGLQLGEAVRIFSQAQRIKGPTRPQLKALAARASLVGMVGVNGIRQQHLTG